MKISEMNNCIEEMRKCYKFEDDKTEIRLGNIPSGGCDRCVTVGTRDENGTQIEMTRIAAELARKGIEKPKGFSTLEQFIKDRLSECK